MRVLIVRLSSLGDVIQSLPVVQDIVSAMPNAQVDWVVEEAFAPLVRCVAGIRQVHVAAQRRWRRAWWSSAVKEERTEFLRLLREVPYDAVIDCQGLLKSVWVARQAQLVTGGFRASYRNASELCSYEWPVRWLVDRAVPMERRVHAVDRSRRLVCRALQLGEPQGSPKVNWRFAEPSEKHNENAVSAAPSRDVWLIHGTTRQDNEWPVEHWVDLARRLQATGCRVVLPHVGEREAARVQTIAQAIGPEVLLLPPGGLDALAQRMSFAHGVIGVDTGLSHLAVALGRRHVQIFSQPRAARAGPRGWSHQISVGGEQAPDVSTVWQAWMRVRDATISEVAAPAAW